MVLKVYAPARTAGAIGAVLMTLAETQTPFELVPIDMSSDEHKTAAYRALQPFAQIPVIVDGAFVLHESRAICRYLAAKHTPSQLVPTDPKAKARFEQGASVEFAAFHPHAYTAVIEGLAKPAKGKPTDQRVYAAAVAQLAATLAVYERILARQRFLGGEAFSLVDVFHVSFGPLLARAGCDLMTAAGPNVARWWGEVIARPSWTRWEQGVGSTEAY
ncbi:glutathione S-transferase [Mycena belliarum]|uniref:glutathione transferase n=1 Tax=Mycena belliarum TaxID=1033014 RepID=A0AAD6TS92_9AGAR|nr:glutathione S-transferase [Mycena belliae]